MSVTLKRVRFLASNEAPSTCTRFYPEYRGHQQEICSYLAKGAASFSSKDRMKRKLHETSPILKKRTQRSGKQLSLSSFLIKDPPPTSMTDRRLVSPPSWESIDSQASTGEAVNEKKDSAVKKAEWSFLMKGVSPPPLCSGHREPCVLRTVKKKGVNFNKRFYSCARGVGKTGDPNGSCNFFKWLNNR